MISYAFDKQMTIQIYLIHFNYSLNKDDTKGRIITAIFVVCKSTLQFYEIRTIILILKLLGLWKDKQIAQSHKANKFGSWNYTSFDY